MPTWRSTTGPPRFGRLCATRCASCIIRRPSLSPRTVKKSSMVRVWNVRSKRRGVSVVAYMLRRWIGGWTHTFTSDNKIGWCWTSAIACREREGEGGGGEDRRLMPHTYVDDTHNIDTDRIL